MAEITKYVAILLGGLGILVGGALGTAWMQGPTMEASATSSEATPAVVATAPETARASVESKLPEAPEAVHADIYFDFKSARLSADSVSVLQEHATTLKDDGTWAVLVQGYADQQGPSEYNRRLAQRRADEVKRFLVELGVAEPRIKVVTIGREGSLCDDSGAACQRLDRRVHLEMRKLSPAIAEPGAASPVSQAEVPAR